ncbi:MAG TPA: lysophospholipid acyltransferase family protein [Planctomycetota bacterium]|nr:lysophospholipid acyltransferase family protein [Planctomycetota bacterium]
MSGDRSALRDRAEWLAFIVVFAPTRVLPAGFLRAGARLLARMLHACAWKRRTHARELVAARLGLPEGSAEVNRIVLGSFQTLVRNALEPALLERRRRARGNLRDMFDVEGLEHLEAARATGRGLLLCTAHIGTWEAIGFVLQELGLSSWAIGRVLDNPLLERELEARRRATGRGVIPKDGGVLKLVRALKANEPVIVLLDQNAGRKGVLLDFLGAPSSHHTVAGVMSRRCGAPALPVYVLSAGRAGRLRLVFEPAVQADPGLDDEAAALQITRRLSDSLERQVRARPEQWLWLHDRWRHARRVLRLERQAAQAGEPAGAGANRMATVQGTNGP